MKLRYCSLYIFVIFIITGNNSDAQIPAVVAQHCYGGTGTDRANCIRQTADGGYIIAGSTTSYDGNVTGQHGSFDYWLVKTDSTGNLEWEKTFGGNSLDIANAVAVMPNGYIIAGSTESTNGDVTGNHGIADYWIVKTDLTGNLVWQKTFGGTGDDLARSVAITSSNEIIAAGWSNSSDGDVTANHGAYDFWIIQLDSAGNLLFEKSYGGTGFDYAHLLSVTSDGGYIVTGITSSNDGDVTGNHGSDDLWVMKADSSGSIEWQKSMGGSLNENGQSVKQTSDGGYIVAGFTSSFNGDVTNHFGGDDCWIIKLDSSGAFDWKHGFGGSANDYAHDVIENTSGGYDVFGETISNSGNVVGNHGNYDCWLLHLDSTGIFGYQLPLGGSLDEMGFSIIETADGFSLAGQTYSNNGDVSGNHGDFDFWFVQLQKSITGINTVSDEAGILITPNPSDGHCVISGDAFISSQVTVSNVTGDIISQTEFIGSLNADFSWLPAGVYMISVRNERSVSSSRLVITK